MPSILTALFMLPLTPSLSVFLFLTQPLSLTLCAVCFSVSLCKRKALPLPFCTFHWAGLFFACHASSNTLMENFNFFLLIFWHAYFSFFLPWFVFFCAARSRYLLTGCQAMGTRLRIRTRSGMSISGGSISVICGRVYGRAD